MHHRAGEGTNTPFGMQNNYTHHEFSWDVKLQYVDDKNAGSDRNEATILIKVLSADVVLKKNSVIRHDGILGPEGAEPLAIMHGLLRFLHEFNFGDLHS